MPQTQRDPTTLRAACDRFVRLMNDVLKLSAAEMARQLGYANSTTVQKVKRYETFLGIERLQKLANLSSPDGGRPNLDWLITGEGEPVLQNAKTRSRHGRRRRKVSR